jgi:hypothetical protein
MAIHPETPADRAAADRMLAIALRTDESGARVYSDQDVAAFVPFLVCTFAPALDVKSAPGPVLAIVGRLAHELGVDGADAQKTAAAVHAHFEKHPPHAGLVEDFERFFREELKERGKDGAVVAGAFAAFAGDVQKGALSSGGPRPKDTVPAGPLAAHSLRNDSKKEK